MRKVIPFLIIVLALMTMPLIISVPLLIYIVAKYGFAPSWNTINWNFFWFK